MAEPLTYGAGPASVDDWLTATAKGILDEGTAQDNIYNFMALLWWLRQKDRLRVVDGGVNVTHQIRYAKMGGGKWYVGAEMLSTQGTQTVTEASFIWRQLAVPIIIDGAEKRANAGNKHQLLPILEERTENALESARDLIATALTATTQVTTQVQSLDSLINTTNTVGGISGTTYSWWQATVTASGSFAARGLTDLMTGYLTTGQGPDTIDLFYSDKDAYRFYWGALQPQMRYVDKAALDAGFDSLKFMGATWLADTYPTSGRIYGVNSRRGFRMTVLRGANFDMNDEVRPANQDAWVKQILFQGATSCPIRRRNWKATGVTA